MYISDVYQLYSIILDSDGELFQEKFRSFRNDEMSTEDTSEDRKFLNLFLA